MPHLHPFLGLELRSGDLSLRAVHDHELQELIAVAQSGIHDPGERPFAVPWTELEDPQFTWQFAAHQWLARASASPAQWNLPLMIRKDGKICGIQALRATDFMHIRTVGTASWIARSMHGQGLGTRVRALALEFAFAHLDAQLATTEAFHDNHASRAVSGKLGYQPSGVSLYWNVDRRVQLQAYQMQADAWMQRPDRPGLEVSGLEDFRRLIGI